MTQCAQWHYCFIIAKVTWSKYDVTLYSSSAAGAGASSRPKPLRSSPNMELAHRKFRQIMHWHWLSRSQYRPTSLHWGHEQSPYQHLRHHNSKPRHDVLDLRHHSSRLSRFKTSLVMATFCPTRLSLSQLAQLCLKIRTKKKWTKDRFCRTSGCRRPWCFPWWFVNFVDSPLAVTEYEPYSQAIIHACPARTFAKKFLQSRSYKYKYI
jgi:hypothetical protein